VLLVTEPPEDPEAYVARLSAHGIAALGSRALRRLASAAELAALADADEARLKRARELLVARRADADRRRADILERRRAQCAVA
jgi:hypothetical protein